jgi:hypothetical protein
MEYLCHCLTPWLAFRGCATAKSRRLQVENRGSYGSLVTGLLLNLRSAIDLELESQIPSEVRQAAEIEREKNLPRVYPPNDGIACCRRHILDDRSLVSASATIGHFLAGQRVPPKETLLFAISGVIGFEIAASVAHRFSGAGLKRGFAVAIIIMSIVMLAHLLIG